MSEQPTSKRKLEGCSHLWLMSWMGWDQGKKQEDCPPCPYCVNERLRAALTEARTIFTELGYVENDKASNTASRGVYVTAKALADSTADEA
jgi:hypothetical protein